jgi:hypothetical protein
MIAGLQPVETCHVFYLNRGVKAPVVLQGHLYYTAKLSPQPQLRLALGLLK